MPFKQQQYFARVYKGNLTGTYKCMWGRYYITTYIYRHQSICHCQHLFKTRQQMNLYWLILGLLPISRHLARNTDLFSNFSLQSLLSFKPLKKVGPFWPTPPSVKVNAQRETSLLCKLTAVVHSHTYRVTERHKQSKSRLIFTRLLLVYL